MKAEAPLANPRTPVLCRPAFLWMLVGLGAALRIFQYASDTSFWFDELSLVRNLVHRSAAQLATATAALRPGRAGRFSRRREGDQPRAGGERPGVPVPPSADRARRARALRPARAAGPRRIRGPLCRGDVRDRGALHPLLRGGEAVRDRHRVGHRDVSADAAAARPRCDARPLYRGRPAGRRARLVLPGDDPDPRRPRRSAASRMAARARRADRARAADHGADLGRWPVSRRRSWPFASFRARPGRSWIISGGSAEAFLPGRSRSPGTSSGPGTG